MDLLDPLLLARWQFGLTTLYHFLFVPLTLGMSFTVAIFQTAWFRTGNVKWLHLTRFFGRIFLINFAMGVVTGIVQEFQFGMNWSTYSRFVGDVFGAPLAFEGLMAFFFEATFIGLWIFGWDKLPKAVHLATIWIAAIGATLSAYFILAANAFMQNPVGYRMAADGRRAELVDIGAVLTNRVALAAFPHTIFAAFMFTAGVIVAVSAWHMLRKRNAEMTDFFAVLTNPVALAALPHTLFAAFMMTAGVIVSVSAWHLLRRQNVEMMRSSLRFGLWALIAAFAGVAISGDQLSLVMVSTQPMKMAAAEAMFDSACGADASFSIFTLGTPDGTSELFSIRVPYLLSLLSTHSLDGCVEGINDLNHDYTTQLFPQFADQVDGNFAPVLWVTYWAFRWMIGLGGVAALVAVAGLWLTRKKAKRAVPAWAWRLAIWAWPASLLAILVGWVFTEMGRQPWVVFGLLKTDDAGSPTVSSAQVLLTLIGFTLLYAVLGAIGGRLFAREAAHGPAASVEPAASDRPDLVLTY